MDIYLGCLVRLLQSACHLISCPGHSVSGSRPVNMGFSDDFGGLGRLYIVCSLIHPLIITVIVLLHYKCAPIRINYRTHTFHFFQYFTYFTPPFSSFYELNYLCGNIQVSF